MIGGGIDFGQIGNTRWDDLSVGAAQTKIGANLKPDFDFTNCGLLFPQNNTSEKIYQTFQMSHKKRLGTKIHLHIHFIQTSALVPVFSADIRFYNNGDAPPAFTTINTSDEGGGISGMDYPGSGSILQIIGFPLIDPPTDETVSANLDIILYRNDNVIAGDVLVKYIDVHYEIDTDGSREEFVK